MSDPEWAAYLGADRTGGLRPNAPVLVQATAHDELFPTYSARQVAADWCAQGADVTYRELRLPGDPIGLGVAHVVTSPLSLPGALQRMGDRLAGRPGASTC